MSSVRNKEGIWINTQVFREAALHFIQHGYYCADPWGSPGWYNYWKEERRRCIDGYTSCGVSITGEHYFYLNFCPIKKVQNVKSHKSNKIISFPDFWDGDYNFYWVREIARDGVYKLLTEKQLESFDTLTNIEQAKALEKAFKSLKLFVNIPAYSEVKGLFKHHLKGGFNLIIGKSRRKGYSYKNASIAVCNYFTKPSSLTIFNAYERKFLYPEGIMNMAKNLVDFINEHTAWTMPSDAVRKVDHIRASFIEYKDGVQIEKGFKSEIMALTCKDNPDVNRGKDARDIIVEEAGAFGTIGLLKSLYSATVDCVRAGSIQTGLITIFGTSGDMESGSVDYADMHSRPLAFNMLPFENIWDETQDKVGFFHPVYINMEGYYDTQGNSDVQGAKDYETSKREDLINNGASTEEIDKRLQENPMTPGEAFSIVNVNNFPVASLKAQLGKIKGSEKGTPVEMYYIGKEVIVKPVLNGSVTPITSYYNIGNSIKGCPMIYEYPLQNAPKGTYKIGYDPIRQDQGTSLASIIVYKSFVAGSPTHSNIVAEYIGRYNSADDIDRLAMMFADYYNTKVMYENEVPSVRNFFLKEKRLDLLALQPDRLIRKNIKTSTVSRVYGCHMVGPLKDAGERYVKEWLETIVDHTETGEPVRVLDRIYSKRLLEELVSYNRKGNFDLISALFMCLFQVEEQQLQQQQPQYNDSLNELAKFMKNMYER